MANFLSNPTRSSYFDHLLAILNHCATSLLNLGSTRDDSFTVPRPLADTARFPPIPCIGIHAGVVGSLSLLTKESQMKEVSEPWSISTRAS